MFLSPHPDSPGGAARDRHGRWKQDAVAVRVCSARDACRRKQLHGRRRRVVLIPRRWDQALRRRFAGDGGYKARYTGESAL
jgi:hypothetical protein